VPFAVAGVLDEVLLSPVAVGIVADRSILSERGPRATAPANLRVFASSAKTAEHLDGKLSIIRKDIGTIPNLAQFIVSNIPLDEMVDAVHLGRQR
jgi:hypothetical protein